MKRLIFSGLLCVLSFNSFAAFSLSYPEIYQKTMIDKEIKKDKAGNIAHNLGQGAFIMSLGLPIVGVSLLVPAIGMSIYSNSTSKEEKVMRLMEEGNKHLLKLTKKLQKSINTDISSDEILDVVKEGLESGLYCQEFPHLHTSKEVRDHVESVLKLRYATHQ